MRTGRATLRREVRSVVLRLLSVLGAFGLITQHAAAQFYVAPGGNDTWPGTIDSPFVTIPRAVTAVSAGGLITVRGGTHVYSTGISLNKNGTSGNVIRLWAYPGETPVLDFASQPRGSSSRGITMGNVYWHVRGLTVRSAGDNGIYITGSNNTVEFCTLYDNEDTGLQISGGGANNLILNCDSYANYDSATHGENADGFAPKLNIGPGNVFRGCRAWDNADDGWDIFEGQNTVLIDSCWAFRNGYNIWGDPSFQGDGNGFKLGGNFVAAPHLVTRSVAFDNAAKGFDLNNNTAGQTIHNCTGYRNLSRNYSFPAAPTTGTHVLRNNVGFAGSNSIVAGTVEVANSWQGFTVTTGDFTSLDTSLAAAPRDAQGGLPATALFRLAAGSDLIDGGVDVGLPYTGTAPDLGAFETAGSLPSQVVLLAPSDGAVIMADSAACTWRAAQPGVTAYWFEISTDSLFGTGTVDSTLTDTTAMARSLVFGMEIHWRVRARNGLGWGPFSSSRSFHTVLPLPPAPQAVSPADGAVDLPLTLPFLWRTTPMTSAYRFQLAGDSLMSMQLLDDSTLTDTARSVAGLDAAATYWWRVAASNASGTGPWTSTRRFSTAGSTSGIFPYPADWTIVALPLGTSDRSVGTLFPAASGPAYSFLASAGYVEADTLEPGVGYWLKFPSPQAFTLSGTLMTRDTLELAGGWNMVGPISVPLPASGISEDPPGVIVSPFYGFDAGYVPADTLFPGKGYWVRLAQPGTLILGQSPQRSAAP